MSFASSGSADSKHLTTRGKGKKNMASLIPLRSPTSVFLVSLLLACFAVSQLAKAVFPPPDGGYPRFNTAEGQNALFSLTRGETVQLAGIRFGATLTAATTLLLVPGRYFSTSGDQSAFEELTTRLWAPPRFFQHQWRRQYSHWYRCSINNDGSDNTATGSFALYSNTTGTLIPLTISQLSVKTQLAPAIPP